MGGGGEANVQKLRFSADEDELLIEFVRHSILYDLKDPEFKNNVKKDLIWNEAGKVLNREGEFIYCLIFETTKL